MGLEPTSLSAAQMIRSQLHTAILLPIGPGIIADEHTQYQDLVEHESIEDALPATLLYLDVSRTMTQ